MTEKQLADFEREIKKAEQDLEKAERDAAGGNESVRLCRQALADRNAELRRFIAGLSVPRADNG
jgi:hypothetical protein